MNRYQWISDALCNNHKQQKSLSCVIHERNGSSKHLCGRRKAIAAGVIAAIMETLTLIPLRREARGGSAAPTLRPFCSPDRPVEGRDVQRVTLTTWYLREAWS